MSETEQATVEQTRAATSLTKAQTAQMYIDMGAIDPSEIRKGLADNGEFEIEKLLDNLPEADLMSGWEDEPLEQEQTEEAETAEEQDGENNSENITTTT
ncbi:hypothetical protein FACS18949_14180 [Clostridia bacterium]|nr:hypothetical protein FACS189425_03180 [Clostridia bacterium]GHV35705.1 hypothetical protein FACS18949_14180 [Clostridia bacterium]